MNFAELLVKTANDFKSARTGDRKIASEAAKQLGNFLRGLLPAEARGSFEVRSGLGIGAFPSVPWIAVFHERWGYGATEGYFVVYLFPKDGNRIYLALGVGAGRDNQLNLTAKGKKEIQTRATDLRKVSTNLLDCGFTLDSNIDLGSKLWRPQSYAAGTAAFVEYSVASMPDPQVVESHFNKAFKHFQKLIETQFSFGTEILKTGSQCQFFSSTLTRALLAKPFLILTGPSGTGKTCGATQIAEQLCAEDARELVAVGADWTDNRHVLGYLNPLEKDEETERPIYETTAILELVRHANDHPDDPHVLILDEMNLSHVERYFADFLSAMELSNKVDALKLHSAGEAVDRMGNPIPDKLDFPENLFVIGTVNIDETTYMFSPKVLDRANVIEIHADETAISNLLKGTAGSSTTEAAHDYGIPFLDASRVIREKEAHARVPELPQAVRNAASDELMKFFKVLEKARCEFGYRSSGEIIAYLRAAHFLAGHSSDGRATWAATGWQTSLDELVLQKLLPKLHGSRSRLSPLLGALATLTATGDEELAMKHFAKDGTPAERSPRDARGLVNAKLPGSYKKLDQMLGILLEEQFVSFIS